MTTRNAELAMMYGDDPYSFVTHPTQELDMRVGRDPKIESLPTSMSEAQYDQTFMEQTCQVCGKNKGDTHVCRTCASLIKDRFGKDATKLPERALRQMWWTTLDEKEARAAGKSEADIKLQRRKRRQELKEEKRREKRIKRQSPVIQRYHDDLSFDVTTGASRRAGAPATEDWYADFYSLDTGELKRPLPDPEVLDVVQQLERERLKDRPMPRVSRHAAFEFVAGPGAVESGGRRESHVRTKLDKGIALRAKNLKRAREDDLKVAPGSEEARKVQHRINKIEKGLDKATREREDIEEKAPGYITDYVKKNRRYLVRRYWSQMSQGEKQDIAREILEGRQDPYVTSVLEAFATRALNANSPRRRAIGAPPPDFSARRSRPF